MSTSSLDQATTRARKEAARWFMRMQSAAPDHEDRSSFEHWLLSSELHMREYRAIAQLMDKFSDQAELKSLANIIEQNKRNRLLDRQMQRKRLLNNVVALAAIALSAVLTLQGWSYWQKQPLMQLASATPVGQVRAQRLDDGSELTLNANSQIDISYFRDRRQVKLNRGEVVFEVARDEARPFIIDTDTSRVTVLGTRFVVNRLHDVVRVSVDHGMVRVESLDADHHVTGQPLILVNGQVAEIYAGKQPSRSARNAESAFGFLTGTVAFEQAGLPEIAETLSRYRNQPVMADHHADGPRVTALVQLNNLESFLHMLPKTSPVTVNEVAGTTRLDMRKK